MESNRNEYGFAALALAFVTGGLIGAAFGLLFAPRTGVATREKIKGTTETVRTKAEELATAGKEKVSEVRGKVQQSVEKAKEKVSHKKEEEAEETVGDC